MKKTDFKSLNTKEKIKYLLTNGKTITDLLRVDINKIEEQNLDRIYDLFETYQLINSQAAGLTAQLESAAEILPTLFEEDLDGKKLDETVKKEAVGIFNGTIVPVVTNAAKTIQAQYKKTHDIFFNGVAASGAVDIMQGIIDFRKKIDQRFPGVSDTIIVAATNALVSVIGLYSPTISTTLNTYKFTDHVKDFLNPASLEKVVKVFNNKFDEIKKDKDLAEIHHLGEKLGELSTLTSVSVESLRKIGFDLKTVEKTIATVSSQRDAKEFIQYLGDIAEKMPPTKAAFKENLQNLEALLLKGAKESGMGTGDVKKFENLLKNNIREVGRTYSQNFEEGKNAFDKASIIQQTSNLMNSSINEFKKEILKNPQNKAIAEKFERNSSAVIKDKMPSVGPEIIQKAKRTPILAKELGLNLKVELALNKALPKGLSK